MSQHTSSPRDPRWLALAVLCTGQLMIILDGSIVTVAMPAIKSDLGFSQAGLTWVVNAYLIAFGGLLLLAGRLGDLIGRRRMLVAGLVVFTAASLLCGVADSQPALVGARFLQGAGGAMASAVILGMIVTMFPERHLAAKGIGVFSFVSAAGGTIGILAGGFLTEAVNWHWIFFVNIPIGVGAIAAAVRLIAADRGIGLAAGADVLGAVLVTAGLMLAVYTIAGVPDSGWTSANTVGFGAVSVVLIAGFFARQARARSPLMALRILRSRQVSGANLVQMLMVASFFGFQFLLALYLQLVLGYDTVQTGLAYLPTTLLIAAFSLGVFARLNARLGEPVVLLMGLALAIGGFALLARLPVDAGYLVDLLPAMLVLGAGGGLALPAIMSLGMSGATPSDSGLASGLINTTQQVGGALGLAVLATLASGRTGRLLAEGDDATAALAGGYRLAFTVGAVILVVAAATTAAVLLRLRPATTGDGPQTASGHEPQTASGDAQAATLCGTAPSGMA